MAASISLHVRFIEETQAAFSRQGINLPWPEDELLEISEVSMKDIDEGPMTIEDVALWIERRVEHAYSLQTGGKEAQLQVLAIRMSGDQPILDWKRPATELLKNGDTISVESNAISESNARPKMNKKQEEMCMKMIRKQLRFDLNDRVLCDCGPRWLAGHIVGTAVPDEGGLLPYLVKTDPLPGLPSGTISVPRDDDWCCIQEVCFTPEELHLIKAGAPVLTGAARPKLRFGVGDAVVCRVSNDATDGLERWIDGMVGAAWPELPGARQWEMNGMRADYPAVVPYRVDLAKDVWVYCHKDQFTLIRRKGWEPQQRVKGLSQRMEVRKLEDGHKEKVDHQTERRKPVVEDDSVSTASSDA